MRSCLFILFILITQTFYSQSPDIDWQNTIGGNGDDQLVSIHATSDNGYILGGFSNSGISGDKIDPGSGFYDYWVVKLNSFGVIEWQKCIGGNFNDILTDLQPTLDGGYILGGFSNSVISGNKTESSIGGSVDYWVVKLNATGEIEWQNTIGGVGEDDLYSICVTMDNGYLLGGRSNSSISGDKSEASDEYFDYWVVKLNATGEIEWQNTIGGSEYDYLYKCVQVDGGYILGGMSTSHISGDKTDDCIGGSNDFWVLKLDNVGNIIWQKTFGGIGADWLTTIVQAPGQRLIFGGYSNSAISGNKTVANYDIIPPFTNDFWIINTDSVGNINWQNDIGGIDDDYLLQNEIDSSGLILGGYSKSGISGIKTTNNIGFEDYWTIYVDSVGNIVWQKTDGGWSGDKLESIDTTFDGGYILGGFSSSPISGDKTEETFGSNDYWVIKLHGNCNTEIFYADIDGDGFGNQLDSILACVSLDIPHKQTPLLRSKLTPHF